MIIEIRKIGREGCRYTGEELPAVLDLDREAGIRGVGPLHYDLHAELVRGSLVVRGRVWAEMSLRCGRCAEFFSTLIAESDFIRDYPLRAGQLEVDITGDLREAVILQLPNHPLCSRECRGLCPKCGANLNTGPCDCLPEPELGSDVWRVLDGLRW